MGDVPDPATLLPGDRLRDFPEGRGHRRAVTRDRDDAGVRSGDERVGDLGVE